MQEKDKRYLRRQFGSKNWGRIAPLIKKCVVRHTSPPAQYWARPGTSHSVWLYLRRKQGLKPQVFAGSVKMTTDGAKIMTFGAPIEIQDIAHFEALVAFARRIVNEQTH